MGLDMRLRSGFLVVLVVAIWLISELGPEEVSGPASICGIGVAVIALVKLLQEQKARDKK